MLFKYRTPIHRPDLFWIVLQVADLCLSNDIWPYYHWLEGKKNITADRLSRFLPLPFEHCAVSGLHDDSLSALALLRLAVLRTAELDVDRNFCDFGRGVGAHNRPDTQEPERI